MKLLNPLLRSLSPYAVALLGVLVAAGIRYQLGPVLASNIPVVIFTVPVVLSALYGGFWAGLFCTIISGLVSDYLFMEPYHTFSITHQGSVILTVFFAIGLTISFFGQRMRNLQNHLAKQSKEINKANLELEEAHSRKDEFLAILAHELRNPLAGISTAAELLKFGRTDERRIIHTGEVISRQVKHMTKLVDDLLDVSRVTRGLVVIERTPVDMKEALQGAVEQVRSSIDSKQQRLALQLPNEVAYVSGDRIRIVQVISNLMTNANRYSPVGSLIQASLIITESEVEVVIEDNGQGIDPKILPKIFELFVQADRSIDRSQGGLGIGLALVSNIVSLHGGRIAAYSDGHGKGSRFTVTLPKLTYSPQQASQPARIIQRTGVLPPLQILVVDDNRDAADSTGKLLEAYGHVVFVEYDASRALDRIYAEEMDVIILDIGLPGKDGLELCRLMQSIPHLKNTVFIALSGYGHANDLARSSEAGFHKHLTKPVSINELLSSIAITNK